MLISKIKIEPAGMLSDTHIDSPLGSIKLRARFEQIERRPDHRRARSSPGGLVVAAPQPVSEMFAANGPSFSMAVRYEIGECDPGGSVKQLLTENHLVEH
jgi:hypothetical protein